MLDSGAARLARFMKSDDYQRLRRIPTDHDVSNDRWLGIVLFVIFGGLMWGGVVLIGNSLAGMLVGAIGLLIYLTTGSRTKERSYKDRRALDKKLSRRAVLILGKDSKVSGGSNSSVYQYFQVTCQDSKGESYTKSLADGSSDLLFVGDVGILLYSNNDVVDFKRWNGE